MLPVSYPLLANRMRRLLQEPNQLLVKLQSTAGLKYFTLSGPLESPSTVSLDLDSIIHTPGRSDSVDSLFSGIQATTHHRSLSNDSQHPLLPAGFPAHAMPSNNDSISNMSTINVSLTVF